MELLRIDVKNFVLAAPRGYKNKVYVNDVVI